MIYISSALKQQEIIDLLTTSDTTKYTFIEKKGIKLAFETDAENEKEAADMAKAMIKATDFGKVLYFQVTV